MPRGMTAGKTHRVSQPAYYFSPKPCANRSILLWRTLHLSLVTAWQMTHKVRQWTVTGDIGSESQTGGHGQCLGDADSGDKIYAPGHSRLPVTNLQARSTSGNSGNTGSILDR
ncbi:hypothetical protein NDU88_006935 [Pleurodeles waltl]|uniref:Uncharacterized protein n=1 Tax=Pleurodeles waltl TaxID=8319 RepID=A0AAV7RRJ6_PLEWA|nr:hypothetical protein NDU88_006935 [Pleurodeles waltl]